MCKLNENQKMQEKIELVEILSYSEEDIANGRVGDAWEMLAELEEKYAEGDVFND